MHVSRTHVPSLCMSQAFADIKAAVLACFRLDAEEYRQRYRSTAVSPSCGNYTEVCDRLFDLFDKWMSHSVSSGSKPTLQTVADEMVREQLVAVLIIWCQVTVTEFGVNVGLDWC